MGTNFNFKNFVNEAPPNGGGSAGRPPGNFLLTRQSSVYSLTFDEFQSTMGGIGKDFGSMNMDELLKNIWSAEENQGMGSAASGAAQNGVASDGYLQKQGSLTLPRTLSQKTVDEVWRDILKEFPSSRVESSCIPQRQQTLGEITIEEFLVRAGVVREDAQLGGNSNATSFFGDLLHTANNQGSGFGGYQQQPARTTEMMGGRILDSINQISVDSANLPLNVNEVSNAQQQFVTQQTQQPQQMQQSLLSKPAAYGAKMAIPSSAPLSSRGMNGRIVGISDPTLNNSFVQSSALKGGGIGMVGLAVGAAATGSPSVSLDGHGKSNGDASSVSPVPYAFSGGVRGRKSNGFEKVVERRQRRMIKNRESAARSRDRKQAYMMELEAEVAKLKEENQELWKKQAEMMEIQKTQAMETMNEQHGSKRRRCLRRTHTGSW